MSIFISHTTLDNALARDLRAHLAKYHGIHCYIDDLDKRAARYRGTDKIAPHIVSCLEDCDALLAIITINTKESWWVPFEIGTARQMPRVISSYTTLPDTSDFSYRESLPEYLLEWPRLRNYDSIDIYAKKYKLYARRRARMEKSTGLRTFSHRSAFNSARNAESAILEALGQDRHS